MKARAKDRLKKIIPHPLWKVMVGALRFFIRIRYKADALLHGREMSMYCPCCRTRLHAFVQGDYLERPKFYDVKLFEGVRQDILCPVCGALPRHRILADYLNKNMDVISGKNVLYFAPERSMKSWLRKKHVMFTTADLNDPDTQLKLDIQATGLPDSSYDIVIANHVLEHVGDYKKALAEIRRILRPDGILLCSFPMSMDVELVDEDPRVVTEDHRLRRFGQSDHVRLFGRDAEKLIEEAGYEVKTIEGCRAPSEILPVTGPSRYDVDRIFQCRSWKA